MQEQDTLGLPRLRLPMKSYETLQMPAQQHTVITQAVEPQPHPLQGKREPEPFLPRPLPGALFWLLLIAMFVATLTIGALIASQSEPLYQSARGTIANVQCIPVIGQTSCRFHLDGDVHTYELDVQDTTTPPTLSVGEQVDLRYIPASGVEQVVMLEVITGE